MLKESSSSQGDLAQVRSVCSSPETSIDSTLSKPEAIPFAEAARNGLHPIPLVTRKAAAGFGNGDFSIEEADVKEYYVIPKFKYCHVDFMIEVSGLSMYLTLIRETLSHALYSAALNSCNGISAT